MGLANVMKSLVRISITAQFLSFLLYEFGFGLLGEVFGGPVRYVVGRQQWLA